MNKKLLAAAVAGAIVPVVAQAVDVSVSGHVNRMIRYADDGHDSEIQHLDSGASLSRWRMTAEGELDGGMMAGATIESAFSSNSAGTPLNSGAGGKDNTSLRHSYIWLSGNFGKLSLGHTSPAGTGSMWSSHSGAWAGTEYSTTENANGVLLRTSGGTHPDHFLDRVTETNVTHGALDKDGKVTHETSEVKGVTLWSAFKSVYTSRSDVLRYDTPSIGPVSMGVSIDGADMWAVQGSLNTDMGGVSVTGGAVFAEANADDKLFGISGGVAFGNGTSVNAAYGTNDSFDDDHSDAYINLSHSWGNTSVAIDYRSVDNATPGMEGQSIGLGFNQSMGNGVDVYAGYHNYSIDMDDGTDVEDVDVFHIGSRVKFN